MIFFNGKQIANLEVTGIDYRDSPDYADAYFSYGCYADGTELTEEELDRLADSHPEILHQTVFDSIY